MSGTEPTRPGILASIKIASIALLVSLGAGLGGVVLFNLLSTGEDGALPENALPLPAFALPDLEGKLRSSDEWAGKVLVINFWATWCSPCRHEIPGFIELQERHGTAGVQFVGIALDEVSAVREFRDEYRVNYPLLVDNAGGMAFMQQLGNRFAALPYTVIVDRAGRVIYTRHGELSRDSADLWIRKLL